MKNMTEADERFCFDGRFGGPGDRGFRTRILLVRVRRHLAVTWLGWLVVVGFFATPSGWWLIHATHGIVGVAVGLATFFCGWVSGVLYWWLTGRDGWADAGILP